MDQDSTNQHDLIDRAKQGDEFAILELLSSHRHKLESRVKYRVGLNPAISFTTDDVLQETYIDVVKGISTFNHQGGVAFSTWLSRVADNRLAKLLRDGSRLKRGGGKRRIDIDRDSIKCLMNDLGEDGKSGSHHLAQDELRSAIELAVATLPDQQRLAVEYFYLQQLSLDDVAEELSSTKDAVRGLLHRAKQAMRRTLGGSSRWFHVK